MDDDQFTTPRETSQHGSARLTNQRLGYATQQAEVLFGSYRRGDANDPERYVTAIAAVLTLYDESLIREATDPRTGIQTSEKFATFMPNAGELKRYCDGIAERKYRLEQLAKIPKPIPASHRLEAPIEARPPGYLANIHVPDWHPRYAKLAEWTKTAEPRFWRFGPSSIGEVGLWVTLDKWQNGVGDQIGKKFDWATVKPATDRDLTLTPETRAVVAEQNEARSALRSAAE